MELKLNNVLVGLIAAGVVLVGVLMYALQGDSTFGAQPTQYLNLASATTSASFSVTTSARVLATTTSTTGTSYTRVYASICNPNSNPVALNLNTDIKANSSTGQLTTWIAAAAGYNVCYEITDKNGYNGSITASSTAQTATVITVQEYVY